MRWRELRDDAVARLRGAAVDDPVQEVRWMVEQASGRSAAEQVSVLDAPVTERELAAMERMLTRRAAGEPLQHVIGRWGFRTLDLLVDARVLIPRPETEVVAGLAIDALTPDRSHATDPRRLVAGAQGGPVPGSSSVAQPEPRVAAARDDAARGAGVGTAAQRDRRVAVDLGTGTGAIALSIAAECWPHVEVWATDASADALAVARANLAGLGRRAGVVRLLEGDWFDALPDDLRGRIDVVVSNPPYVAEGEELPDEVSRWEPSAALVPGPTGLEAIERIVAEAPSWLDPGGTLVLEIGETQGTAVLDLADAAGFDDATIEQDLTGRDRALVARRTSPKR